MSASAGFRRAWSSLSLESLVTDGFIVSATATAVRRSLAGFDGRRGAAEYDDDALGQRLADEVELARSASGDGLT
jgi:hypothetical protein